MLLEGSIRRGLLLFAIPLLGSLVFQMLYNTMDTVIIGYYIGDNALAAIGGVAAIFELIVGLCTGFGQGMAIIIGQAFGSENSRKLSESVSWAAILALGFSLVFMVLGLCFLPALLEILKTPAEVFDLACSYIYSDYCRRTSGYHVLQLFCGRIKSGRRFSHSARDSDYFQRSQCIF